MNTVTALCHYRRVRSLQPLLHECASTHPHTVHQIEELDPNPALRVGKMTVLEVKVAALAKAIADLRDFQMEIAVQHAAMEHAQDEARHREAVHHLVDHAQERSIHRTRA
jgi:hypothetical protein